LAVAENGKSKDKVIKVNGKDMTRKSIVFDKDTPDVFYCIPNKPTGEDKIIVRAKPLHKLCEYEGKPLPEDYKSDCYKDVDESDYACKEKYRIMKRYAKEEQIINNTEVPNASRWDSFIIHNLLFLLHFLFFWMKKQNKTKQNKK